MRERDKLYCDDYSLSKSEEVALGRAALEIVKQLCSRATPRELMEIGCAIDSYIEGADDFSREEQAELDTIEGRLGVMPVWIDPEHVWVRHHGSIHAVPVEWDGDGAIDC